MGNLELGSRGPEIEGRSAARWLKPRSPYPTILASVTGINRVVGRDEQGKPIDRRVRFTDVFIKRDGRWQVWATQGTVIP